MVRFIPVIHRDHETCFPSIPIAIGLFVSVSFLVALCAKHATKYTSKTSDPNTPKSPLPSLITTISHKAMSPLVNTRKSSAQDSCKENDENGVWQKAILMGERCQPPEFSGVIYYDYSGNRIPEMPKSPRASSLTPLRSFNFPMQKNDNSMY